MLFISLSQYEPVARRVLLETQSDEQVSVDEELRYLPRRNFCLKFAKQLIAARCHSNGAGAGYRVFEVFFN